MKKKVIYSILLVIIAVIGYIFNNYTIYNYRSIVNAYTEIKAEEIEEKIGKEEFILYVGRETCPDCLEFIPTLDEVLNTGSIKVYYIDSEYTESDKRLQLFRDIYEIESVPSIIYFNIENTTKLDTRMNSLELKKVVQELGY